jgi:molybdate transport system substrate-binding protein
MSKELRVMTSGAFTAAHLRLLPAVERITGLKVVTVTTSIGTGDISIPNRLKRGEVADLVICDDSVMQGFIRDGLARAEGRVLLAQSVIGVAVRAGAPAPDIGTVDALRDTLLRAASIG